jgi:uncharacterized protein (DUF983 family)
MRGARELHEAHHEQKSTDSERKAPFCDCHSLAPIRLITNNLVSCGSPLGCKCPQVTVNTPRCLGALPSCLIVPHIAAMANDIQNFGGNADSRSWLRAMGRGIRKKCPQCGRGALFSGYTTTAASCAKCGLDLTGHQADDAPPYLTILVVGHVTILLALAVKQVFEPPLWLQFAIWAPTILILSFLFLPIAKGAMVGIQWANRMHGFAGAGAAPEADA